MRTIAARSGFIRSKIFGEEPVISYLRWNHPMARLSSSISAFLFAAVSLSTAGAQPARPVLPALRPQQQAPQAQPGPQQQTPAGNTVPNPTTAPIKPAGGAPTSTQPTAPVTPPVVTYRDGLLTVQANNSTLGSVLNAIRNKTGIEFEGLEGASDHVALSVGPAPAGEVLASIFQGSKFDFVAIGRADDPNIVQRVIMTPKAGPGAVAGAQPQPQQPRPNNNGEGGDGEENPDEQVNVEPQDTAAQPPQVPQQQQPQPQEQPQQQQPKTPEQLLQELQDMRKQQQMQQEGAPPPNPAQVPRKPPQ